MAKFEQIAELIENRIRSGDYIARPFPQETVFSKEVKVSRMTTRKAVAVLIEKGLLRRKSNGRLVVNHENTPHDINLALLAPALEFPRLSLVRNQLMRVANEMNAHVRCVTYVNWNDSIIHETIRGFDGTVILSCAEPEPEDMFQNLRQEGNAFVMVSRDMSSYKIPSLKLSPQYLTRILDMLLREYGHKKIACLNSEPIYKEVTQRIEQWELWTNVYDAKGELFNTPVESYGCPFQKAYDTISKNIENNSIESTAVFCVSGAAAVGASRAFSDHGIKVGSDISVCSYDLPFGYGRMMTPSMTGFIDPDFVPFFRLVIEWICNGGNNWQGSFLYQPDVELFVGESVGLAESENKSPKVLQEV